MEDGQTSPAAPRSPEDVPGARIVLFDGVCNLCHASVRFIIDRDASGQFAFASLQSSVGSRLAAEYGLGGQSMDSVILIEDGRAFDRSTAALRIARRLDRPWPALAWLLSVPRPLRDAVYAFVASRRYRWFGRQDACRLPTAAERGRFLDADELSPA